MGAHKDEDPIRIRFPGICHLPVLFPRPLEIHGEEGPGTINKVRFCVWFPLLWRLGWITYTARCGQEDETSVNFSG